MTSDGATGRAARYGELEEARARYRGAARGADLVAEGRLTYKVRT